MFLFIAVVLCLGGFGQRFNIVMMPWLILVLAGIFVILFYKRRKVNIPPHFPLFLFFVLICAASSFWTNNPTQVIHTTLLFLSGALLWLFAFNLNVVNQKTFMKLMFFVTTFFSVLFLVNNNLRFFEHEYLSLFVTEPVYQNHNYIGDLFGVIAPLLFIGIKPTNIKLTFLRFAGLQTAFLFMAVSFSRSSYITFSLATLYLFGHVREGKFIKLIFCVAIGLSAVFLWLNGFGKSLLFSRPYLLQSIEGLVYYPFGVGFGNFVRISSEFANSYRSLAISAGSAHNIILEAFSGTGVFGLLFVFWLVVVLKQVFTATNAHNMTYGVVFFALTINFMFTEAYFIPTLVFVWFISLGLFESRNNIVRH